MAPPAASWSRASSPITGIGKGTVVQPSHSTSPDGSPGGPCRRAGGAAGVDPYFLCVEEGDIGWAAGGGDGTSRRQPCGRATTPADRCGSRKCWPTPGNGDAPWRGRSVLPDRTAGVARRPARRPCWSTASSMTTVVLHPGPVHASRRPSVRPGRHRQRRPGYAGQAGRHRCAGEGDARRAPAPPVPWEGELSVTGARGPTRPGDQVWTVVGRGLAGSSTGPSPGGAGSGVDHAAQVGQSVVDRGGHRRHGGGSRLHRRPWLRGLRGEGVSVWTLVIDGTCSASGIR